MTSKDNPILFTPSRLQPLLSNTSSHDFTLEQLVNLLTSKLNLKELKDRQVGLWQLRIAEAEKHDVVDSLKRHKVSGNERAYMVDWMIEVIKVFKCEDRTLFVAVMIMDSYYKKCKVYF
jgi:hypothetical protein